MYTSLTTYLFILLGSNLKTGESILALSEVQASIVDVPMKWVFPCDITPGKEADVLHLVASELVAQYVLAKELVNTTLLVHEPEPIMAAVLLKRAAQKGIHILFTTQALTKENITAPWLHIHPMSSDRVIRRMIPSNISTFR